MWRHELLRATSNVLEQAIAPQECTRFHPFLHLINRDERKETLMNGISRSVRILAYVAMSAALLGSIMAPPGRGAASVVTVTAVGKKQPPPPIKKDDVQLFQGKERLQVADWTRGETLFLAILIDDSL